MIKGKLSSTFKDNLSSVDIAVYDKDPSNSSPRELARIIIEEIKANADKEFEIIAVKDTDDKNNEFYIVADPDNKIAEGNKTNNVARKKIPEDFLKTISPFLLNVILLIFISLLSFIVYHSYRIFQRNSGAQKPILRTKTCLKCGMVLDKNQSKCPVCGMEMFKI